MSLFKNLKTDDSIQEAKDSLGGSVLESGAYDMVIDMAYIDQSKGGAMSCNFTFKNSEGKSLRVTEWMTSGNEKGNLNYYVDKNGTKKYLPGFTTTNGICLLSVGTEISEMEPEEKVLNIYSPEAKKEVPTKKQVLMDLLGQEITLGIIKEVIDKTSKDASGNYVPTGETREQNVIDKVFRTVDKMTVAEIKAEADATFYEQWKEKNTGTVKNKAKGAGDAPKAATTAKKKPNLFG